ncbi:MAG TPA: hypothetical protein VI583_00450, partial [Cyclobacteriaceae bacterium]|nr:hypothetical protein [Cyclobacteriaceae bacterium]
KGRLSVQDKNLLENKINTDPALKSEVEIQRDIIGVIRNIRKSELKSMLASTHVGWYHLVPAAWKAAASVVIFTVTGLSAYFLIQGSGDSLSSSAASEQVKPVIEENRENLEPVNSSPQIGDAESASEISRTKPDGESKTEIQDVAVPELVIPQPVLDDSPGNLGENELIREEAANADPLNPTHDIAGKVVTVSTGKDANYDFHYSFSEGNLMLYGNFEGTPYEILEVNSTGGKKYFLYFNSDYFSLSQNTISISPLVKVTDQNLIGELDILKTNK